MTRRPCTALIAIVAAVAGAAPAGAAGPSWTALQDLGAIGANTSSNSALAGNDRGDAVVVLATATGIYVARASAGREFAAAQPITSNGFRPSVAIDERGVALIAFAYDDGTHVATDLRDDDCCVGVKVSVWRPGHRPTRPRAEARRGIATQMGAIAATRGHRGVLIARAPAAQPAVRRAAPRRFLHLSRELSVPFYDPSLRSS